LINVTLALIGNDAYLHALLFVLSCLSPLKL
jgi:hypothetical protein